MRPGLRLTIGAEQGGVARVCAAWAEFAEAQGLPAGVRRSLHMALDELVQNTLSYGFARHRGGGEVAEQGEVSVEVELGGDRVTVTLTDNARPLTRSSGPPPTPPSRRWNGGSAGWGSTWSGR